MSEAFETARIEPVLNPLSRRLRPLTGLTPHMRPVATPGHQATARSARENLKPHQGPILRWDSGFVSTEEPNSDQLAELLMRLMAVPLRTNTPAELVSSLRFLLDVVLHSGEVDACCLYLLNSERTHLRLNVAHPIRKDSIPIHQRLLEEASVDFQALQGNLIELELPQDLQAFPGLPEGFARGCCLAVSSTQGALGTLWGFRRDRLPLKDFARQLLAATARQLGVLLEKGSLSAERATQQRISRELRVAARVDVNQALRNLPAELPIDVAAICSSQHEVGGDLCDLFLLDPHRLMIAVGDASGNSIPAALIMSTVRGALHALSISSGSASSETDTIMRLLNQVMNRLIPGHQFMSLICAVLDLTSGRFHYTNAGHPAPILVHRADATPIEPHGIVLGVCEEFPWRSNPVLLEPGDQLVLLTDGLLEAKNPRGELFGNERLIRLLKSSSGTAQEILQSLLKHVKAHSDPRPIADDHTALILRWQGV